MDLSCNQGRRSKISEINSVILAKGVVKLKNVYLCHLTTQQLHSLFETIINENSKQLETLNISGVNQSKINTELLARAKRTLKNLVLN